jgi:hypothetical protein
MQYSARCSGCGAGGSSNKSQADADAIRDAACTCRKD